MDIPEFRIDYNQFERRYVAVGADGKMLAWLNRGDAIFLGINDLLAARRYFMAAFRTQAAKEAHAATQAARDAELLARDDTAHLVWI